jgi:acetyltransferase-like isoleucine patch superfamily enzyme
MIKLIYYIVYNIISKNIPFLRVFYETQFTQVPIKYSMWIRQKIFLQNNAYFPIHKNSIVTGIKNIYAGIEVSPGYSPGCYIQGIGKIYIGDYTQIAPNVGIISANHDSYDNSKHIPSSVYIGKYCWIGMGAIILPGVILGDYTIVGAGSIVTKSFIDGYCIIGGNPAKLIKKLDANKCVFHKSKYEYNGYIKSAKFEKYIRNNGISSM